MAKEQLTVFSWEAPEFKHYPKNPAWFITFGIILALLVVYQVIQADYFGAISFLIIGVIVGFFARHEPKTALIEISDRGIHINHDLIPYTRIRQFWIIDNEHHKTLNFETTAYLNHLLTVELHDLDSDELREFLADILPEHEEPKPTMAQQISRWFRF